MTSVKAAASAASLMLLMVGVAAAKPVTTTADTNLRKEANTTSPILTLVPKGTSVEVGTCTNGWCAVTSNGQDGFIIARNLGMGPPPAPPQARAPRPRRPAVVGEEMDAPNAPVYYEPGGPAYVVGPPPVVYYGYGPYYGPYYGRGWGWRGGYWRRW